MKRQSSPSPSHDYAAFDPPCLSPTFSLPPSAPEFEPEGFEIPQFDDDLLFLLIQELDQAFPELRIEELYDLDQPLVLPPLVDSPPLVPLPVPPRILSGPPVLLPGPDLEQVEVDALFDDTDPEPTDATGQPSILGPGLLRALCTPNLKLSKLPGFDLVARPIVPRGHGPMANLCA